MNSINQKEPNPSFSPTTHATPFLLFFETPNSSDLSSPFKGSLHCGPLPEFTFRTFDNDDNVIVDTDVDVDVDPLKCFSSSNIGDIGLDDDIFSIYIDVKKLEEKEGENVVVGHHQDHDILQKGGGFVVGSGGGRRKKKERSKNVIKTTQPRKQRQRRSGQKGCCLTNETKFVEPRKAMAAEELAELWAVDPKRAKRIVANRHSAARSKERKAQCIINLEEKVKKLNWEVTSLTTRLTSNQRETTELAGEKSELKCQLQTMECQTEQIDVCHRGNGLHPDVPTSVSAVYSVIVSQSTAIAATSQFPAQQHDTSPFACSKLTAYRLNFTDADGDLQNFLRLLSSTHWPSDLARSALMLGKADVVSAKIKHC
ncbi:hypothetical protein ACH5RR_010298 [Cinchona calisaya]|uniref:BZIP domain-containing protein n=1 Tax=Cinchona calisaya TaxID=153742 RepID=A0ABD3AGQ1_9GENT